MPFTSSIQNVAETLTETAFGPPPDPARKAVFDVPPPVTGTVGVVETCSVVVERIVCPAMAACRTEFGLSTIGESSVGAASSERQYRGMPGETHPETHPRHAYPA